MLGVFIVTSLIYVFSFIGYLMTPTPAMTWNKYYSWIGATVPFLRRTKLFLAIQSVTISLLLFVIMLSPILAIGLWAKVLMTLISVVMLFVRSFSVHGHGQPHYTVICDKEFRLEFYEA